MALAGGDWSSSPTVFIFPDVHLNGNCAVNCSLAVFLVYLTATDTCLYWSRLLPTARQVKWWSSSVVTRVPPSPALDMSSERKLALITLLSGREQSCDVDGVKIRSKTNAKSAKTVDSITLEVNAPWMLITDNEPRPSCQTKNTKQRRHGTVHSLLGSHNLCVSTFYRLHSSDIARLFSPQWWCD